MLRQLLTIAVLATAVVTISRAATGPINTVPIRIDESAAACSEGKGVQDGLAYNWPCTAQTTTGAARNTPFSETATYRAWGKLTCPNASEHDYEIEFPTLVGNGQCGDWQPTPRCRPAFSSVALTENSQSGLFYLSVTVTHKKFVTDPEDGCDDNGTAGLVETTTIKACTDPLCRRDDDNDSFSPDDDEPDTDCDDTNPDIYPGAEETHPQCGEGLWPETGDDYNCDGTADWTQIDVVCPNTSPIVIDVAGNGFSLTNADNGVVFNITGHGPRRIPWTSINSDDSWLALDRNGNGRIDSGAELFGNWTPQPPSDERNGFLALAVFDSPSAGGNSNGWFDSGDAQFAAVKLWRDANHDGQSQPSELQGLLAVGVSRISLNYHESKRTDQWGNWFRFRARVMDTRNRDIGRWAWDVFFPSPSASPGENRPPWERRRGGRR